MKYLIVEDDFSDVALLKFALKRKGCDVTLVNPNEALQKNRENMPGVVQLDGLDGKCFELYQQMQQENPDAKYLLFSARRELYDEARTKGMKVFDKGSGDSYLLDYIGQLLKK